MSEDSPSLEIERNRARSRSLAGNIVSWELARLRQIMPGLVSRAMAYSAMPQFDQSLVDAVKFYYGLEMDVSAAESEILADDDERVRFFPWLLWDWRTDDGANTIGECFLKEDLHSEFERRLLAGLCGSHIGFYEALTDATLQGVKLQHLLTGRVVELKDEGLDGELLEGQILQCRLVEVACTNGNVEVLIDAVYAVLPAEASERIMRELTSLPAAATGETLTLERFAPELLEVAEQILDGLALPEESEIEVSPHLVLAESRLRGAAAVDILAALQKGQPDFTCVGPGQWRFVHDQGSTVGFVAIGSGRSLRCGASELHSLNQLRRRLKEFTDHTVEGLCSVTDFGVAIEGWVAGNSANLWLTMLPEVLLATRQWLTLFGKATGEATPNSVDAVLAGLSALRQS